MEQNIESTEQNVQNSEPATMIVDRDLMIEICGFILSRPVKDVYSLVNKMKEKGLLVDNAAK